MENWKGTSEAQLQGQRKGTERHRGQSILPRRRSQGRQGKRILKPLINCIDIRVVVPLTRQADMALLTCDISRRLYGGGTTHHATRAKEDTICHWHVNLQYTRCFDAHAWLKTCNARATSLPHDFPPIPPPVRGRGCRGQPLVDTISGLCDCVLWMISRLHINLTPESLSTRLPNK